MKNCVLGVLCALSCCGLWAQVVESDNDNFKFETQKENPITSVKDQHRSGTCWAYSTLGFFESELLRMGKGEYDLCEMFVAHKSYEDRAMAAVRTHGDVSFAQGGSFYDVVYCMKHYGICPEGAMPLPGSLYGEELNDFTEFFPLCEAYVDVIAEEEHDKLSPVWHKGLTAIIDTYLGEIPTEFKYKGATYTPKSFMESLGLNMDDYLSITSYTHHPFYETFILEIQDNWRWASSYNVTMEELVEIIDNAVEKGYTVAWGADVSEDGFGRNGIAVCPNVEKVASMNDTDMERWLGEYSAGERREEYTSKPYPEIRVTQEMRQTAYDNWETTDDHGMLIYGKAKDLNGKEYFMVKNSWGADMGYRKAGTWYASKTFVAYKTMNILVHKDAVPKYILEKLGAK